MDPFATHPITMKDGYEELYAQGWRRWSTDFEGPERHLFPCPAFMIVHKYGGHDQTLHYAMLSVIATQMSMIRNGSPDELAIDLQTRTITAQRATLEHEGPSDARILTVLCIISNTFATDSAERLTSHLQSIDGWLQKRGGVQFLGFEGIIADHLYYFDMMRAILTNTHPLYSMMIPAVPSANAPKAGPFYDELTAAGLLSHKVATAARDLVVMIKIYERAIRAEATPSEATYFAYLANVLEYQLASLNALHKDTHTLEECVVLACTLTDLLVLRNYGHITALIWTVEDRLWRCLDTTKQMNVFNKPGLRRIEWYLTCMGALVATRGKCRHIPKVVQELVRYRQDRDQPLMTFEQLCNTMEDYGWCKSPSLSLFSRLWMESSRIISEQEVQKFVVPIRSLLPSQR